MGSPYVNIIQDDTDRAFIHALNVARGTDYRGNLTTYKYAVAVNVIKFLEPPHSQPPPS